MATSGSKDFSVNCTTLIDDAISLAGGLLRANTNPQDEHEKARRFLNMMLKDWQAEEIGVWMIRDFYIPLSYQGYEYDLGPAGKIAYSLVQTTLSAAASSGGTTITPTSVTGFADGYYVGVQLDDGTLEWTTASGDPSTTVTLNDALTDDAASGNYVYCFPSMASRPIGVYNMRVVSSDGNETPMSLWSRSDYANMTDKDSTGTPNSYFFDPQLTNATLKIWPAASDVSMYLRCDARIEIDDMDATTDDFEVPKQFYRALVWNLAEEIMPWYRPEKDDGGVWAYNAKKIEKKAQRLKNKIEGFDSEDNSVIFTISDD